MGEWGRLSGEIKYEMDIEKCIGFHPLKRREGN